MFTKILVFALVAFFVVGAEAQPIPSIPVSDIPMNDDEEFLEDEMGEPTVGIPGALCFHGESISVIDFRMIREYEMATENLKLSGNLLGDLCLREETLVYWRYSPIQVPESFLSIPGTYVDETRARDYLIGMIGIIVLVLLSRRKP